MKIYGFQGKINVNFSVNKFFLGIFVLFLSQNFVNAEISQSAISAFSNKAASFFKVKQTEFVHRTCFF